MRFLHTAEKPFIHGDLKSANGKLCYWLVLCVCMYVCMYVHIGTNMIWLTLASRRPSKSPWHTKLVTEKQSIEYLVTLLVLQTSFFSVYIYIYIYICYACMNIMHVFASCSFVYDQVWHVWLKHDMMRRRDMCAWHVCDVHVFVCDLTCMMWRLWECMYVWPHAWHACVRIYLRALIVCAPMCTLAYDIHVLVECLM